MGWTYAVVMGGDGISDENAMLVTEGYGPVVTSPVHAAFVGARRCVSLHGMAASVYSATVHDMCNKITDESD